MEECTITSYNLLSTCLLCRSFTGRFWRFYQRLLHSSCPLFLTRRSPFLSNFLRSKLFKCKSDIICVCHETQTLLLILNWNPTPNEFQNVLCSPSHCPCLPLTPGNTKELREQEFKGALREIRKDMHFLAQEMSDVKKRCVRLCHGQKVPACQKFRMTQWMTLRSAVLLFHVNDIESS